MSNEVIRVEVAASVTQRVWLPLVAGLAALAGLATQVPGPGAVLEVFSGTAAHSSAMGAADTAALVVASCLVWPLLGWGLVVALLSLLCRVPGLLGGAAMRGLGVLVPRALRPLLVAGVGLTLAAGLAGCSQPGGIGSAPGAAAQGSAATGPITAVIRMAGEVGGTVRPPAPPQVTAHPAGAAPPVALAPAAAAQAPDGLDLDWPRAGRPAAPARRRS